MRDFVPVFLLLNVVPLHVHTFVDPVFVFVLGADRSGPGQGADNQRGSESGGSENSERTLGHDCILRELGCDEP
jgi:hypothetical protein